MTSQKGKERLCQSNIGDFNIEQINGSPFYNRYVEFVRIFKKYLADIDAESVFAQPVDNPMRGTIDWYINETQEDPESLESLRTSDPAEYDRYSAMRDSLVAKMQETSLGISNPNERAYLDCALKYLSEDYADKITYCFDDKITFAVWGMGMRKGRILETVIKEDVRERRTHKVTFKIEGGGRLVGPTDYIRKHNHILSGAKDIPQVMASEHYKFVKWTPEAPHGKRVLDDVVYVAVCNRSDDYVISFVSGVGGQLAGEVTKTKAPGSALSLIDFPTPQPQPGYKFDRWNPEPLLETPIDNDQTYEALFSAIDIPTPIAPLYVEEEPVLDEPLYHTVTFCGGDYGDIDGVDTVQVADGQPLDINAIPMVNCHKGYRFKEWDRNLYAPITEDTIINAVYEEHLPWWKRLWLWITGSGCLKWLLWALLILLLIIFFLFFLKSCTSCTPIHRLPIWGGGDPVNGVVISDSIHDDSGTAIDGRDGYRDDNGVVRPVTGDDGRLPDNDHGGVVAPVYDDEDEVAPIDHRDGVPDAIANRLFLFLENEEDDLDAFAQAFKTAYPGSQYQIIGYDKSVKYLVVKVPENERDEIHRTIKSKIPNFKFIVFDEDIYEINNAAPALETHASSKAGWHLDAIRLKQGWAVTKGAPTIKVAIVDDGIERTHPMLKDKIVDAYNVFTQNNHLSVGAGHGTHTAGLAVGSSDFFAKGASGVAPECKLMPVQVFDNGKCPLSALVAGVMYAIHHDADVINVSIGPSLKGFNQLPKAMQSEISRRRFKNLEYLWTRVCKLAAEKKSIIVFSAGNDDIISSVLPENRNMSSIVVTAVDKNLKQTEFTNYGDGSDISAPGKDILSSFPVNTFQYADGTSMSAPIVSGAVALMKSIKKDITVAQARDVMYSTGIPVQGNLPPMLQLDKALDAVKRGDFARREHTNARSQDVVSRARQVGSSGDLKVTLLWNMKSDIDLHVVEPNGNEIYYRNSRSRYTSGYLDVDNTWGGSGSAENIFWNNPPHGKYKVYLVYYDTESSPLPSETCKVVVFKKGAQPATYSVKMSRMKQKEFVTEISI